MKTCSRCKVKKPPVEFYADKTKADGRHTVCKQCALDARKARYNEDPEKYKARMRAYQATETAQAARVRRRDALRDAAHAAYGARCQCCGETEPAFLTVDHVGGWGAAHRKEVSNVYQWLKNAGYPQDGTIRILCWNCNCAEGVRGGCPHRNLNPEEAPCP